MNGEIAVFCGNANPKLAEDICQNLRIPLGQSIVSRFSDGEIKVKIEIVKLNHIEQWCGFIRKENERSKSQANEEVAKRRAKEALASREATDTPIFGDSEAPREDSRKEPEVLRRGRLPRGEGI